MKGSDPRQVLIRISRILEFGQLLHTGIEHGVRILRKLGPDAGNQPIQRGMTGGCGQLFQLLDGRCGQLVVFALGRPLVAALKARRLASMPLPPDLMVASEDFLGERQCLGRGQRTEERRRHHAAILDSQRIHVEGNVFLAAKSVASTTTVGLPMPSPGFSFSPTA